MKNVFLIKYSVKGIKTLDKLVTLSFYKKTISKDLNTQEYNVKGIYGMNGSGKSGIVTSVEILKNILINPDYLHNPFVQDYLNAIVNKKMNELFIEAHFLIEGSNAPVYYKYEVTLSKSLDRFTISHELLSKRKSLSNSELMEIIFEIERGQVKSFLKKGDQKFYKLISQRTMNLLDQASVCALFYNKFILAESNEITIYKAPAFLGLLGLCIFGSQLHVYVDQSDDHKNYFIKKSLSRLDNTVDDSEDVKTFLKYLSWLDTDNLNVITITNNFVAKNMYERFESTVRGLYKFLRVFKDDLRGIEIDKKDNRDSYICDLLMIYDSYKIRADFESTGIKKLIKIYTYLQEVVRGGIVFIDEFDSNLHDVYLCALLEYLMNYADGQLCFTTHNVGPMDVLKQHKKSIDFLSMDGEIYPWIKSGNYSPAKLYRNGMIEGSPFNVDSIDFIGVFNALKEDR